MIVFGKTAGIFVKLTEFLNAPLNDVIPISIPKLITLVILDDESYPTSSLPNLPKLPLTCI